MGFLFLGRSDTDLVQELERLQLLGERGREKSKGPDALLVYLCIEQEPKAERFSL